jgi:hypothetical protein
MVALADPVEEARTSNMRHRPIGLGVQGLADAFIHLRMPFDSDAARVLNKEIFETIYHAALTCSCELARDEGAYASYVGSPVSKGVLQYDMYSPLRHKPLSQAPLSSPSLKPLSQAPLSSPSLSLRSASRCPAIGAADDACRCGRPQVERAAIGSVGLGGLESQDCGARRAQLAACGADAHCLDGADPRQQRVLRAVHVQRLLAPCACGRVCCRQQGTTAAQGARRDRGAAG